jgi:protein gp37
VGDRSAIEWTEATWNPVTGCTAVSTGCDHCYAERLALRLQAMGNPRYRNGFEVTLHEDLLELPMRWRAPRTVFVNSMSDLFHPKVPTNFIRRVFATMELAERHTFQVLTKRPKRAVALAPKLPWPTNVWLGVSVEDQDRAWRVDDLRKVPAAVRFLSCEPLLGPLELNYASIGWVIVGGESGPGARRMDVSWVRQIQDACRTAGIAFFFKQWGGRTPKAGGRELDGRTYDEMPERRTQLPVALAD